MKDRSLCKLGPHRHGWIVAGVLAVLIVSSTAYAERPIIHVAPEVAVGGLTQEEFTERQTRLQTELTALIPARSRVAPLQAPITKKDLADLSAPAPNGNAPLRVGVVKPVTGVEVLRGQAFKHGTMVNTANGGFVWTLSVVSPGAQAIRVHLSKFSLPRNVEMYFFGEGTVVDGPYTGVGRNGDGDFWTRSIASDTGFILIRSEGVLPDGERRQISFVVQDVGHIRGRPPQSTTRSHDSWPCSDNAPCVVDANCGNAGPAEAAKDANAKMEWIAGAFINTCTGGLLADTDASTDIPLFLTANHCTSKSVSSLETFFNYTTDSCEGSWPDGRTTGGTAPAPSTIGFTVLASKRSGDFTLGRLNEAPPAGAVFLGWTNLPIANTEGAGLYRISNPNFGPQAFSEHAVNTTAGTCRGWPRGERIYSTDITGGTMGGSSGAPVVNSAGEVVGQLSGCCGFNCADECDATSNSTVDGALAFYYDSVAEFLDPQGGGGGCTLDSECDDGQFCNGAETCAGGSCQGGSNPCLAGETCDEVTDTCSSCSGGQVGDSCSVNADCCSNKCKGRSGAKTCK